MVDKKSINALDPENTPAADDLLYLRKGGGSNVDRKVVLPADSVLRRSEGAQADHDAPATAEKLARLDRMDAATDRAYSRSVGTDPENLPDVASFAVTESGVVPEMIGQGAIVDIIENTNGTAVRWESGVQVIRADRDFATDSGDSARIRNDWSLPAPFLNSSYTVSASINAVAETWTIDSLRRFAGPLHHFGQDSSSINMVFWRVDGSDWPTDLNVKDCLVLAIGFYK